MYNIYDCNDFILNVYPLKFWSFCVFIDGNKTIIQHELFIIVNIILKAE